MDILVVNAAFLVTVDESRRIIRDGALAIEDGRIVQVGKTDEVRKSHGTAEHVIDASKRVVIPGMMNCHCHTTDQLTRGLTDNVTLGTWISERVSTFESGLKPGDVYISAAACFLEGIKNGVTTFADPGGPHMDRVVQALQDTGVRAVVAERLGDISHRGGDGSAHSTDDVLRSGEDFVKRYNGAAEGRARAWFSLRTERTTSDELGSGVKRLADQYHVGIETHMANNLDAVMRHKELFRGKLPLMRYHEMGLLGPNLLLTHCNWLSEAEVELVKRYRPSICATPTSNIAVGSGGLQVGNTERFVSAGVNVALGCSGSSASNFLDMIRVAYCLAAAQDLQCDPTLYPPEVLLEMLTVNGARALLWDSEIGSLEVGKRADVVLVDTRRPEWVPLFNPVSNLVFSSSGDAVDTVMVDGKIVMEKRRVTTVREEDILESAQQSALAVAERTGARAFAAPAWKML